MLIRSCRRWRQSQPTATRIVFAIEYHPHGALANFGGELYWFLHGSIFSRVRASIKPGAIHLESSGHEPVDCGALAYDAEDDAIEELGMDLVEDYHHVQLERQPLSLA